MARSQCPYMWRGLTRLSVPFQTAKAVSRSGPSRRSGIHSSGDDQSTGSWGVPRSLLMADCSPVTSERGIPSQIGRSSRTSSYRGKKGMRTRRSPWSEGSTGATDAFSRRPNTPGAARTKGLEDPLRLISTANTAFSDAAGVFDVDWLSPPSRMRFVISW